MTHLDPALFEPLFRDPEGSVQGRFNGHSFTAKIAIPNYDACIARQYKDIASSGLQAACLAAKIPFDLPQFGLVVTFANMAEIPIHDEGKRLDESLRALVGRFGAVIIRNAHMESGLREQYHRNIFPHLRFHFDRGADMPNQISCFTRDPFDAEQRLPRASSTLFIANIVAWLETQRAGGATPEKKSGRQANYDLFKGIDMTPLLGDIVLEQPWSEPEGTGEIVVIDNRTALHATYHKNGTTAGYRIGARYLI